jgi:hypothetical protein
MLVESPTVEPSPLCPDPSREAWKEKEDTARTPSPLPLPLCKLPTGVVSPTPAHSAPPPRQNPASTCARPPRSVLPVVRRQGPRTGHILATLAADFLAYKSPLRAHDRTHPIPSKPPRHPLFSLLALVHRSQLRRRATGRGWRHRVRPPLGKRTPGTGGGVSPESFPPRAVKPCFPYVPRRRHRLPLHAQVSSLPRRRTRRRRAVGLESNGSVPIRVT